MSSPSVSAGQSRLGSLAALSIARQFLTYCSPFVVPKIKRFGGRPPRCVYYREQRPPLGRFKQFSSLTTTPRCTNWQVCFMYHTSGPAATVISRYGCECGLSGPPLSSGNLIRSASIFFPDTNGQAEGLPRTFPWQIAVSIEFILIAQMCVSRMRQIRSHPNYDSSIVDETDSIQLNECGKGTS